MAAESIDQGAEPKPAFFDLSSDDGRRALDALLESSLPRFVHDEIADQIGELLEARDPTHKPKGAERTARIERHLASIGVPIGEYGMWVFYPWSSRLVHVLPRDEYRTVRTARNRYKITQPEQDTLYAKRIGVVGLSVGNSAAVTFALEGIGGAFKVADFDLLSLSNMNRLRSGAPDIGVNKTVLAAREMLDIARYPRGVTPENMDDFLLGGGKLDLLVEECDDLYVKIVIRERCKALGIPVIMDTSDRGLLDVERFDREPDRPIMHGLIGDVSAESLKGLPTKDKVPIFLAIVGGHRMSARMAASLPEIDQTIGSWPQLASAVALGGAITADAGRRLLLGTFTESGRWYVDVESIARNGTGELTCGAEPPRPFEISPEARVARSVGAPPPARGPIDRDTVSWLVANAILAPSAHNGQPWEFVWRDDALELRHDPAHDLPSLDYDRCATWAAFGAVVHNIELAARSIGLEPEFSHFPNAGDERLVSVVHFARAAPAGDALLEYLPRRVTNRRRDGRRAIAPAALDELRCAADEAGARLQVATSDVALDELAALMGACDRISNMNQSIHGEVMDGFRWSRDEVEHHRDGLDIATMELTPSERAGTWLLSKWEIMETLKRIGGGVALEDLAKKCVASTSAIGLLTTSGVAPSDYLRGGRALQRVWLTATKLCVALQPWTGLPYLFARVERGGGAGLSSGEIAELRQLRERYRRVFDIHAGDAEVLLFRLSLADAPSAISLRRPVDRVLTFA